jgi:hypothetical protein
MNVDDYFDLKSFSYFPRGFSREQFLAITSAMPSDFFTFGVPGDSTG